MEVLVIPFLLVLFSVLAFRFGYDSGPHVRSQEEDMANAGFQIDDVTISVMPDPPTSAASPASKSGGRAFGLRTGKAGRVAA